MSIFNHFQHIKLTNNQHTALENIAVFLLSDKEIFTLKGYAGTGKTTLLKGICDFFTQNKRNFQLMAPTGRAAMVIQNKTKYQATTIHKAIYNFGEIKEELDGDSFQFKFGLKANKDSIDTVYIIDEASMISDVVSEDEFFVFASGRLLKDLLEYVFSGFGRRKIIFTGDNAQLPPVGMNFSPIFDLNYLKEEYQFQPVEVEITEVVRQKESSGLLNTATEIRNSIHRNIFNNFSIDYSKHDIVKIKNEEFIDIYTTNAKQLGIENVIVITHSNKQAQDFNKQIREKRFGKEKTLLQRRDKLIITKNNYNGQVILLNGMFAEVVSVGEIFYTATPHFYIKGNGVYNANIRFREICILVTDIMGQFVQVKTTIIEDFLYSDSGVLHPYDQRALYIDFKERMAKEGIKPKTEKFNEKLRTDLYFNAIQAKFGYAITCHKAQGGEWEKIFVDFKIFLGKNSASYFRWIYTAITRAQTQLFCIDVSEYNALNEYIVKEISQLSKPSSTMYYSSSDNFIEERSIKLKNLCELQNINYTQNIFNNQIACEFKEDLNIIKAQFWFSNKGFTNTTWVLSSSSEFNERIKFLAEISLIPDKIPFLPKFEFQQELHSYINELVKLEDVRITNIVQKDWSDLYFIKTEAESAYIEFHYNQKYIYTSAQPYSTLGQNDKKLISILNSLKGQ